MNTAAIKHTIKLGDVWHRVDGGYYEEGCIDVELDWQTFRVVKLTTRGAWIQREYDGRNLYGKRRFVLACGARFAWRTKAEALDSLIARKRRQLAILRSRIDEAEKVTELAKRTKAEGVQE